MNLAILSGRVASDMETRTAGEHTVTNFRLITSEYVRGEERTATHRVTVWGEGSATYLGNHVKKGDLVELKGRIHYDKYDDEAGVTRYTTEIVVDGNVTRLSQAEKNRS